MRFILLILSLWFSAGAEEPPVSNSESGCGMDPLGGCSAGKTWAPNTDEGCGIDPLGGCSPDTRAPQTDEGCHIDPLGGCRD